MIDIFWLDSGMNDEESLRRALRLFAFYRLYSGLRYSRFAPAELGEAFGLVLREGAR